MKISVRDIGESAEEVQLEQPGEMIDTSLANGPREDFRCDRPVRVSLSHYRAGEDLFFEGTIRTGVAASCARCLEDYRFEVDEPFHFLLAPRGENLGDEEDLGVGSYEGDEVDLAPLVRDRVLLSLPTTPLCDEGCNGLCATCGANLNHGTCACKQDQGDERMAIFRTLRVNR